MSSRSAALVLVTVLTVLSTGLSPWPAVGHPDPATKPMSASEQAAASGTRVEMLGERTESYQVDHLRRMTEAWTPSGGTCTAGPARRPWGSAPYW
jgi:hypothetical protein